uniref:Uncharacterized protein n=1 Tax=Zonotrichia albicollis TaxID=44394 RepID=A0A8D2MY62_ZONAL
MSKSRFPFAEQSISYSQRFRLFPRTAAEQSRHLALLPEPHIFILQFQNLSRIKKNVLLDLALILSVLVTQFKVFPLLFPSLLFESCRAWEEFRFTSLSLFSCRIDLFQGYLQRSSFTPSTSPGNF